MAKQSSGTGKGGKSFQDRELAAEVRTLTLEKIRALFVMPRVDMNSHDADLHDRILEKLAGSVLPRLNEHSGVDGQPIIFSFDPAFNVTTSQTTGDRKE